MRISDRFQSVGSFDLQLVPEATSYELMGQMLEGVARWAQIAVFKTRQDLVGEDEAPFADALWSGIFQAQTSSFGFRGMCPAGWMENRLQRSARPSFSWTGGPVSLSAVAGFLDASAGGTHGPYEGISVDNTGLNSVELDINFRDPMLRWWRAACTAAGALWRVTPAFIVEASQPSTFAGTDPKVLVTADGVFDLTDDAQPYRGRLVSPGRTAETLASRVRSVLPDGTLHGAMAFNTPDPRPYPLSGSQPLDMAATVALSDQNTTTADAGNIAASVAGRWENLHTAIRVEVLDEWWMRRVRLGDKIAVYNEFQRITGATPVDLPGGATRDAATATVVAQDVDLADGSIWMHWWDGTDHTWIDLTDAWDRPDNFRADVQVDAVPWDPVGENGINPPPPTNYPFTPQR